MQLIDEKQQFPFIYACVVVGFVILGAYFVTHVLDPAPASANRVYWYMARSSGITAYGLLSLAVLLGASSSGRIWDRLKLRKLSTQMHQYSALLVAPFVTFHLCGLYMDKSVPFTWMSLLLPFTDKYRVIPVGLGVLVLYGWVLLILSSYVRERIGVKLWRSIHIAAFPMFVAVTIHGLLSGTDTGKVWSSLLYIIPSVLLLLILLTRWGGRRRHQGTTTMPSAQQAPAEFSNH